MRLFILALLATAGEYLTAAITGFVLGHLLIVCIKEAFDAEVCVSTWRLEVPNDAK